MPSVILSVKGTISEYHFCREMSAVEESLMQIRGAVTIVTIALKRSQGGEEYRLEKGWKSTRGLPCGIVCGRMENTTVSH